MTATAIAPAPVSAPVSAGKPATTVLRPMEIPKEGLVTVRLLDVDNKFFQNYRTSITDDELESVRESIDRLGQIGPGLGSWNDDGTKVRVVCGYCRFECLLQIALKKVVKEYNEHFSYKPGDDKYIALNGTSKDNSRRSTLERQAHREQIRNTNDEWAAKYDAALANEVMDFKTKDIRTQEQADVEAELYNIHENERRNKPSFFDLLAQAQRMLSRNVKAKIVAEALGISEGAISQMRGVMEAPAHVRKLVSESTDLSKDLGIIKEKENLEKQVIETALNEWTRRMQLPRTDPAAIGPAHSREYAGKLLHAKDPLNLKQAVIALKELTRINQAGNPQPKDSVPDITVFKSKLADYQRASKLGDQPPAEEPAADATAATGTAAPVIPAAGVTVADLATQQAADQAVAALTTGAAATSGAMGTVTTPVVRAEDAAAEAAIKATNAAEAPAGERPPSDIPPEDEFVSMDDLTEASDADLQKIEGKEVKVDDGSTRTKTTEAVTSKYVQLPPEKLEILACSHLKDAAEGQNITAFDIASFLLATSDLFHSIGMTKESEAVNMVYIEYVESANQYIRALETHLEKASDSDKENIRNLRPKFAGLNLAAI